ncbi:MAG: ExbD/TolR family protein [Desulfovibrio sp.]|uniref:ExbD/TolR family protein n=1 Tax=Desulfovibrio sp. 7SRBS1 TaxID=3378064 RepID=UPI003B40BBEF
MRRRLGYRSMENGSDEINMTPLIDMVFILLIFFLVTTSFVREAGIEVNRPSAQSAETKEKTNLLVAVAADGQVFIEGKHVDIRAVRARMQRFLADMPQGSVIVVADKDASTGATLAVLDNCRMAGVKNISVAAKKAE